MVKWICVKWFKRKKWTFSGHIPKRLRKVILVGGPFTSREDVVIAVATLELSKFKAKILVNRNWFRFPWTFFLNSVSTLPYLPEDEKALETLLVNKFTNRKSYAVLLSPEGSLERNDNWNTGFYNAALRFKIPVCVVTIDHRLKDVKFHSWFEVTGDKEKDMEFMRHFLAASPAKYPEKGIFRTESEKVNVKDFL